MSEFISKTDMLKTKLNLIRSGETNLFNIELEAAVVHINTSLSNSCNIICELCEATLDIDGMPLGDDSVFDRLKNTLSKILNSIVDMFLNFVQHMKAFFSRITEAVMRRKSTMVGETKYTISSSSSMPMPENILQPKVLFSVASFKTLVDGAIIMATNAKATIDTMPNEDRRSANIRDMLKTKLFGDISGVKLDTYDEYMKFIYGETKEIKLKTINLEKLLNEIGTMNSDMAELERVAMRVKRLLNETISLPEYKKPKRGKASPVIEYQVKLYTELSVIANRLLTVYGSRCAILVKIEQAFVKESKVENK